MLLKKLLLIAITCCVIIFSSSPSFADETEELKKTVKQLCTILIKTDKAGFENMLAADQKSQMRWWWESSGKGKYFTNLFGSCKFDHIDKRFSTKTEKKVFIQRYNKDGTKWSRPAPVTFKKNASGQWKIISYSL